MGNYTTEEPSASMPTWDTLEAFARLAVQRFLQRVLEEEVTELLGRVPWERRSEVDPLPGHRNGYGKPRRLSMSTGTITLRRPRVRGLADRFESRALPLFRRRTKAIGELLPQLYLHGLAQGDFDLALRGLLGAGAPLSPSSIARLKAIWQTEYDGWRGRSLTTAGVVYLWVDGLYVKAGLEREKAAMLVAVAGLQDGSKEVVALESGYRESNESWSGVLRDLKERGMPAPRLVIGDGHLGIWGALANVYPEAAEQRCWNHRIVNVLDKLPKKEQPQGKVLLTAIPYAETREDAERLKQRFQEWCLKKGCEVAGRLLEHDWERLVTFYQFPKEHWKHLRTTNVVESPFAAVRLRTTAAKRYKKVENATVVIWKTLMVAQKRFRKLNAPHLLAEVAAGAVYINGVRAERTEEEAA